MSAIGDQPSGRPHPYIGGGGGGVIFLLNKLPFDSEDDSPEADPNLAYRVESLAATYLLPLEQILRSRFNAAGFIRAIYVNFGPMGYYELNPNSKPITPPEAFEAQLRELFRAGIISKPDNTGLVWRQITDLSTLLSNIPPNSRKLGCLHGAGSEGFTDIRDYIKTDSDEQIYLFVVGEIDNQEIQAYIDDYVKVSDYDLISTFVLDTVITVMERKWSI